MLSIRFFDPPRNLRNNRTRIHVNLFIAMCIQVLVRLIVYIDQYISRAASSTSTTLTTPLNQTTSSGLAIAPTRSSERKGIEDTVSSKIQNSKP